MALFERSKLYKDVWSRPCTKIAAGLGISSSALKRICIEKGIPTPVAGYWMRLQCGEEVSKDPRTFSHLLTSRFGAFVKFADNAQLLICS